jgi:alkaline phosphatase
MSRPGWLTHGAVLLLAACAGCGRASAPAGPEPQRARYVILFIADGWGYRHVDAANRYAGGSPVYQSWSHYAVSTFPANGSYDPGLAWSVFDYIDASPTDSAAAASALFTGQKTANGRICVSADGSRRYDSISDLARGLGLAAGAVTSVYVSHATPGAWMAHNDDRSNGYAIADEGYWGDPNTTGTPADHAAYAGSHGPTLPPLDVLIGAGHPAWSGSSYVNQAIRDRLANESGAPGAMAFVERMDGSPDGGARLLGSAAGPSVTRLAGLFGGTNGNLEWRLADGSGANAENPTLAEMTSAALQTLDRDPDGFVLLVEGGAVDWAGHDNHMDRMVGEMLAFQAAVGVAVDWVDSPANQSDWSNTLVIVTGDHETGHLTAGPNDFPDRPLGEVSPRTLLLEKVELAGGRTASWEDLDGNDDIDVGEAIHWMWHSGSHTNSLIPLYAKGANAGAFASMIAGADPVRGDYVDNTAVFRVVRQAIEG